LNQLFRRAVEFHVLDDVGRRRRVVHPVEGGSQIGFGYRHDDIVKERGVAP
jgi:hypothetical protein